MFSNGFVYFGAYMYTEVGELGEYKIFRIFSGT